MFSKKIRRGAVLQSHDSDNPISDIKTRLLEDNTSIALPRIPHWLQTKLSSKDTVIATGGNHDLTLMYTKELSLHSVLMLILLITGVGRKHYGVILFEIKKLAEEEKIKLLVHEEIFNWKNVSQAHRLIESAGQKRKVVLVIE